MAFEINENPAVRWVGEHDITADDLLSGDEPRNDSSKLSDALDSLKNILCDGEVPSVHIYESIQRKESANAQSTGQTWQQLVLVAAGECVMSNWIYSGIYIDEGKKCCSQCNAMIANAKAEKFDLIITKSVFRFSRNVVDCVSVARDLLNLKKPLGFYFENESFHTLQSQAEIMLTLLRVMAIAESENKGKSIGCVFRKNLCLIKNG